MPSRQARLLAAAAGCSRRPRQKAAKKKARREPEEVQGLVRAQAKQIDDGAEDLPGVIQFKQAHWVIAAAARIGQLFQDFSGQLYTAPVPKAGPAPAGYPQEEFDACSTTRTATR